eukprot:378637-Pyramimonas_sp.AAC.1
MRRRGARSSVRRSSRRPCAVHARGLRADGAGCRAAASPKVVRAILSECPLVLWRREPWAPHALLRLSC